MSDLEQRPGETPIVLDGLTIRDGWVTAGALNFVAKVLESQGHRKTVGYAAVEELEAKIREAVRRSVVAAGLSVEEVEGAMDEVVAFAEIYRQENR